MKNLTVLKAASILHLILTTVWSLFYLSELYDEKGWGILFLVGLYAIGIIGLLVSWITGFLCKKYFQKQPRRIQNTIEVALLTGFIVYMAVTY
ncbi:MAG: hypothetical protein Tsb0034_02400 [Ekhidna sp.]